jgi:capsular polysaccharide biosynthesis protein
VHKPEIKIFKFDRATFYPLSDILRIGDQAFWEKQERPQFVKMIPQDCDLLRFDSVLARLFVRNAPIAKTVEAGYSLCGVHVNSWGHFLVNFLPKLFALPAVSEEPELKILVPDCVDEHIRRSIAMCVKKYGDFEICYLDATQVVACDRLYFCNTTSFLGDHGHYGNIFDVHVTRFSLLVLRQFASAAKNRIDQARWRKLYIARRGGRSLLNSEEVEDYFSRLGFEVIFPHLLNFDEKVRIFAEASHVCGPYSSGFGNVIFCQPGTKILALTSFSRTTDSYLSAICENQFDLRLTMLTGHERPLADPHNSYEIPIARILRCINDVNFLS